jgi:TPR repeat protein
VVPRLVTHDECQTMRVSDENRSQVVELCERAASGSVVSYYELGVIYADGRIAPRNEALAVRLLLVAAQRGLRPAQVRLNQMGYRQ